MDTKWQSLIKFPFRKAHVWREMDKNKSIALCGSLKVFAWLELENADDRQPRCKQCEKLARPSPPKSK